MVNADVKKVAFFVVNAFFKDVAVVLDEEFEFSLEALSFGVTPTTHRTLPKRYIDTIIDNFGILYYELLSDSDFRDFLVTAIELEKHSDFEFMHGDEFEEDAVIIDFDKYDDDAFKGLMTRIGKSMTVLDPYAEKVDATMNSLPLEERGELGYIIGNFYYLVRALANSRGDTVMSYLESEIGGAKYDLEGGSYYAEHIVEDGEVLIDERPQEEIDAEDASNALVDMDELFKKVAHLFE